MLEILPETTDDVVAFRVSGKHIHDESHKLAGLIDARIAKYGHARCLVEIAETQGIALSAIREGLSFDLAHGKQIERCAVIGDHAWERWLTKLLGLFFSKADLRFFSSQERETALEWIREG